MKQRRVTLADIARADGTHVTTVSLALRNSQRLPETTRKRIRALADKLGYKPDPTLQALVAYRDSTRKRASPNALAYVTNWTTRWGWKNTTAHPDFYSGAESAASSLGYHLEHFWIREPGLTHGRLNGILKARGINGVVVASHARECGDTLRLDWPHLSAVKIDYFPHQPALHNVTNNQCNIVRLAMRHALELGYKRIGLIMHRGWDHSVDRLWTAGYLCERQDIPEENQIPALLFPEPEPVEEWINERENVAVAPTTLSRWMRKWKPEVIISKGSFVLPLLADMGIEIPRDLGFIDLFLDNRAGDTAGVWQNHEAVGSLAVQILAGQLTQNVFGVPEIPTTTYVDGTWLPGATLPGKDRNALTVVQMAESVSV